MSDADLDQSQNPGEVIRCSIFCKHRCSEMISSDQQSSLKERFSALTTERARKEFYAQFCQRLKIEPDTQKRSKILYSLPVTISDQNQKVNVCQKFFFQVLGLSRGIVGTIARTVDSCQEGPLAPTQRGRYERTKDDHKTNLVKNHIMTFRPHQSDLKRVKCPKHVYLDSSTGQVYSLNVNLMHRDYLEKHPNKEEKVGYTKYRTILGSREVRDALTKQLDEKCEACSKRNIHERFRIIKDSEACESCILKQYADTTEDNNATDEHNPNDTMPCQKPIKQELTDSVVPKFESPESPNSNFDPEEEEHLEYFDQCSNSPEFDPLVQETTEIFLDEHSIFGSNVAQNPTVDIECSKFCTHSCSQMISKDQQLAIKEEFETRKTERARSEFYAIHCQRSGKEPKRKKPNTQKRKMISYSLTVTVGDESTKVNVCQKFFFQVLGLGRGCVSSIARSIDRCQDGILMPTLRGKYERKEDDRKTVLVKEHIRNFHLQQLNLNSGQSPKQYYLDYKSGKFLGSKSKIPKIMFRDFLETHPNKDDVVGYTKYLNILRKDVQDFFNKRSNEKCAECSRRTHHDTSKFIRDPNACKTCILKHFDISDSMVSKKSQASEACAKPIASMKSENCNKQEGLGDQDLQCDVNDPEMSLSGVKSEFTGSSCDLRNVQIPVDSVKVECKVWDYM